MSKNKPLNQLDVHNSFLHGEWEKRYLWFNLIDLGNTHYACKLQKALYGFKQDP